MVRNIRMNGLVYKQVTPTVSGGFLMQQRLTLPSELNPRFLYLVPAKCLERRASSVTVRLRPNTVTRNGAGQRIRHQVDKKW